MYHSVRFGDKDAYTEWQIIPNGRPIIVEPEPKYIFDEIPGGNGSLDLTDALTGNVTYNNRQDSIEFIVLNETQDKIGLINTIANYLHGKRMNLYLEDEPNYFYTGRFKISDISEEHWIYITIDYDLDPFKYDINETVVGPVTVSEDSTEVSAGAISRELIPTINLSDAMDASYKNHVYALPEGNSRQIALLDLDGDNTIIFSNTNLFNKKFSELGKAVVASTGDIEAAEGWNVTEMIAVKPNTVYYISSHPQSNRYGISWLDESAEFISGAAYTNADQTEFTSPANAAFALFSLDSSAGSSTEGLPKEFDAVTYDFGTWGTYHTVLYLTQNSYNATTNKINVTATLKTYTTQGSGLVWQGTYPTRPIIGLYFNGVLKASLGASASDSFYLNYREATSLANAHTLIWTGDIDYTETLTMEGKINVPNTSATSLVGGTYTATGNYTPIKPEDPSTEVKIYNHSDKEVTITYRGGIL